MAQLFLLIIHSKLRTKNIRICNPPKRLDMQAENIVIEYKSLRKVQSGDAGFKDLAITCVCLANAQGGKILIGIEDKEKLPPSNQVPNIPRTFLSILKNKLSNSLISMNYHKDYSENKSDIMTRR